jgi:hypothetical protein
VPGQGIERGERLVENKQPGPPGQGQGQRELRPLPAGQSGGLLVGRDAELRKPGMRIRRVEAPVMPRTTPSRIPPGSNG